MRSHGAELADMPLLTEFSIRRARVGPKRVKNMRATASSDDSP